MSASPPALVGRLRPIIFPAAVYAVAAIVLVYVIGGGSARLSDAQLVGQVAAFLLAALGLNLLVGNAGMHSFGQGAFLAVGAYAFMHAQLSWNLPVLVAIVIAVAIPAVLGALTAIATTRMRGPQLAMVTLILAVVVQRFLAEASFLGQFGGYPNTASHGSSLLQTPTIFGVSLEPPLFGGVVPTALVFTVLVAATSLIMYRRLAGSPWGRSLSAIKESELLASHLGVNVYVRKIALISFAAAIAGLGGACYALVFAHLQPETFTLMLGVNLIIMVILGGSGTILGPVVGTGIIVYLQTSSSVESLVDLQNDLISDRWFLSAQGLIALAMLIVLFVMPAGIVGSVSSLWKKRPGRRITTHGGVEDRGTGAELFSGPIDRDSDALTVQAISRSFGGIRAVNDVSLSVGAGTTLALIGPNGAGKSTVVNVISGVYATQGGSIRMGDLDLVGMPSHQRFRAGLSRTFQTPMVAPHLTIRENVSVGCASTSRQSLASALLPLRRERRRQAQEQRDVDSAIAFVGLTGVADRTADELSYGQQRALELARALVSRPRLLVLDEPAAGLNPTEVHELGTLLKALKAHGLAIVLVEHHMDLVREVADRVVCMIEGQVVATGSSTEVLSDERVMAAYLGSQSQSHQVAQQGAHDA